jgi:hypothetical protein
VIKFFNDWRDTLEYEQAIEDGLRNNEQPDFTREELAEMRRRRAEHLEEDAVWLAERNNFERLARLFMARCQEAFGPRARELIYQKLTDTFEARPGAPPERTPEERRDESFLPQAEAEWDSPGAC